MLIADSRKYRFQMELRRLCINRQYFTCGLSSAYHRMFEIAVNPNFTLREIALFISANSELPPGDTEEHFLYTIAADVEDVYYKNCTI